MDLIARNKRSGSAITNQANSVTDPLDFQETTVPELSHLDTLLRCDICKEYYTSPVLSSCGHSFCSLCIRRYLVAESKCALCGRELRESGLMKNAVLEEIVGVFGGLRGELIDRLQVRRDPKNHDTGGKMNGEKDNEESIEVIDLDDEAAMEQLNSTEIENTSAKYAADDDDDDVQIIGDVKKRKSTPVGLDSLFRKRPKSSVSEPSTSSKKDHKPMAECPICQKILPIEILESTHIDSCLSIPQPRPNSSPRPTTPPKKISPIQLPQPHSLQKLSKLDFASLSTQQLKTKLQALQLPTGGSRFQLEQRYVEYTSLWNANCDSSRPKDPRLLRWELSRWEGLVLRDMDMKKNEESHNNDERKKKGIRKREGGVLNKDEWKELVRIAKEKRKQKVKEEQDKETLDNDGGENTKREGDEGQVVEGYTESEQDAKTKRVEEGDEDDLFFAYGEIK